MKSVINSEKAKTFFTKLVSNALLVVALTLGYFIGFYVHSYKSRDEKVAVDNNPYHNIKYPNTLSAAVDDANGLLLIDRATGEYQVYSDSVGIMIFKLYASKIYANQTSK